MVTCHLFCAKALSEAMLDIWEQISVAFEKKIHQFCTRKWIWKWRLQNDDSFNFEDVMIKFGSHVL